MKIRCHRLLVITMTLLFLMVSSSLVAAPAAKGAKGGEDDKPKVDAFSNEVFAQCPQLKKIMSESPVNIAELTKMANQPATTCNGYAQYTLGQFYSQGKGGVAQNYTKGAFWYRRAADQGNASAQYALGWMYTRGEGVIQNDAQAVAWWKKAALGGNSSAQFYLAWAYNKGKGVPKNDIQSYAWLSVAVAYGVGSNLDISQEEKNKLQAEAMKMRDQIRGLLAQQDKKDPKAQRLQHANTLANQYYQQSLVHLHNSMNGTTQPKK